MVYTARLYNKARGAAEKKVLLIFDNTRYVPCGIGIAHST